MKLKVRALAAASALAAGGLYLLYALFFTLAPSAATVFLGYVYQVELSGIVHRMTWDIFFTGFLFWTGMTYVFVAAAAWLYNKLLPCDTETSSLPAEHRTTTGTPVAPTTRSKKHTYPSHS